MNYIQGFVVAAEAARMQDYRRHGAEASGLFKGFGVDRQVDAWGDDVPDGKRTDFRRAVKAGPGEVVVFSWMEHASKADRDSVYARMMEDPRMQEIGARMPFDGKRMIFGGFETVVDEGRSDGVGYVDGMLAPAIGSKEAFAEKCRAFAKMARAQGALRVVDGWGDDVPEGEVTDMRRAVAAEPGETVIIGWIEWPSRAVRDAAWAALMAGASMSPDAMGFDPQRMITGGFEIILDV